MISWKTRACRAEQVKDARSRAPRRVATGQGPVLELLGQAGSMAAMRPMA
jgi:hypothetical protein